LRPVRQRRAELETNLDFVRSVLRKGIDGARSVAVKTLEEVREVMNMKI
jgi:tryptophanyl-tRNA synthetase